MMNNTYCRSNYDLTPYFINTGDFISFMHKGSMFGALVLKTYNKYCNDGRTPEAFVKVFDPNDDLHLEKKRWNRLGVHDLSGYYLHNDDQIVEHRSCEKTHVSDGATSTVRSIYNPKKSFFVNITSKAIPAVITEVYTVEVGHQRYLSVVAISEGNSQYFGISDRQTSRKRSIEQAHARAEINKFRRLAGD